MDSLRVTDDQSKAVQKTENRVSLDSMMDKIDSIFYTTLDRAMIDGEGSGAITNANLRQLEVMTICVLVMQNGFIVIGKAAPADPENYNRELGQTFAREDAIRQLWPLEGYALKEKLANREA